MQAFSVPQHADPTGKGVFSPSPTSTSGGITTSTVLPSPPPPTAAGTAATRTTPSGGRSPLKQTLSTPSQKAAGCPSSTSGASSDGRGGEGGGGKAEGSRAGRSFLQEDSGFTSSDSRMNIISSASNGSIVGKSVGSGSTLSDTNLHLPTKSVNGLSFSSPLSTIMGASTLTAGILSDNGPSVIDVSATQGIIGSRGVGKIGTCMISTAATWAQRLCREFLFCDMCQKPCVDPVQFIPKRAVVCRECLYAKGLGSASLEELPLSILHLIDDIRQQASSVAGGDGAVFSSSPILDGSAYLRSIVSGEAPSGDPRTESASGTGEKTGTLLPSTRSMVEEDKEVGRVVGSRINMTEGGGGAPLRMAGGEEGRSSSSSPVLVQNSSLSLNSYVVNAESGESLAQNGTGMACTTAAFPDASVRLEEANPSPSSSSDIKVGHSGCSPQGLPPLTEEAYLLELQEAIRAEEEERQEILSSEESKLSSFNRRFVMFVETTAGHLYYDAKYEQALRLYSYSIEYRKKNNLPGLSKQYGNRSLAYFMLLQYQNCCDDCNRGIECTEDEKCIAILSRRGASAALAQGDLSLATNFLQGIPASARVEEDTKNIEKYQKGKHYLKLAEKSSGTKEAVDCLRILVIMFTDSYSFRLRLGQSLMKQSLFRDAIDVMSRIREGNRPPALCMALAECYYQSGFEFFAMAKKILRPVAGSDPACQALLEKINEVDRGKQEGNDAFAHRAFDAAVKHYTTSILKAYDNKRILRILFSNRAAANKELGKYQECIDDCTKSLENDPFFWKAYSRRARCHLELHDAFAAVDDFKKAIENDKKSEDPGLRKELQDAENRLAQEEKREKDYYYQLGVGKNATDKEIKLKFRELSLKWHPDKCIGKTEIEKDRAEVRFKRINEAYSVLSDPQRRRDHDYKSICTGFGSSSSFAKNRGSNMSYSYW